MQLYVPDTATAALIQRQSAHSAVVLPGAFPLAHFGVVALKRVAMRQVARKIDPELQVQLKRKHQHAQHACQESVRVSMCSLTKF